MANHPDWARLEALMPTVREFQALALEHGIEDVFQDNGGKILQMLLALNLKNLPGREGNDAVDSDGREYELKSVNIWQTPSFSTHHHMNIPIIEKYRQVCWVFAIYEGIELRRAYQLAPEQLEPYFAKWRAKWIEREKDLNNPKIPLNFVMGAGELVYSDQQAFDLPRAATIRSARTKESAARRAAKKQAQAGS